MTFQPMPAAIVRACNANGDAARNPAMQVALSIHLAEPGLRLISGRKSTLSLGPTLEQQCRLLANRRLFTLTNRTQASIATAPPTLSP
jgi:hypothetical protein